MKPDRLVFLGTSPSDVNTDCTNTRHPLTVNANYSIYSDGKTLVYAETIRINFSNSIFDFQLHELNIHILFCQSLK